jgi:hypothetical protein
MQDLDNPPTFASKNKKEICFPSSKEQGFKKDDVLPQYSFDTKWRTRPRAKQQLRFQKLRQTQLGHKQHSPGARCWKMLSELDSLRWRYQLSSGNKMIEWCLLKLWKSKRKQFELDSSCSGLRDHEFFERVLYEFVPRNPILHASQINLTLTRVWQTSKIRFVFWNCIKIMVKSNYFQNAVKRSPRTKPALIRTSSTTLKVKRIHFCPFHYFK